MTKQLATLLLVLLATHLPAQTPLSKENITWARFEWADPEAKDVMLITSRLDTLDYLLRWQLDTGSPYTYLEGGTFQKFINKFPYLARQVQRADTNTNGNWYKINTPPFRFDTPVLPPTIWKNDQIGGNFPQEYLDRYKGFSVGTIGVDNFRNRVLILDFKGERIGYCDSLTPHFYQQQKRSSPFRFYKNRIILPVQMGTETRHFMYDCGASLFTLNLTPKNAGTLAPRQLTDTLYGINNGESGAVYNAVGGKVDKPITLLGKVYRNMIVFLEKGESAIFDEAKVAGAIGNKLFLNGIVVIDFTKMKFTLVE